MHLAPAAHSRQRVELRYRAFMENLPSPEMIVHEIVEDWEATLAFAAIAKTLQCLAETQ